MFKPFYIHRNKQPGKLPNHKPRGFTALISPVNGDNRKVAMAVTFCSPKDEFNKATGRLQARDLNKTEVVNAREVAKLLAACSSVCGIAATEQDFQYTFKHML